MKKRADRLTREEVTSMLNERRHWRDAELSARLMHDVFVFPEDDVLLVEKDTGRGLHHVSVKYVRDLYESAVRERAAGGALREFFDMNDFVARVPTLVDGLPSLLGIDPQLLDGTEPSLRSLDRVIRRFEGTYLLRPEVVAALVAYVGHVLRQIVDGRWEMSQPPGATARPVIVSHDGVRLEMMRLAKDLNEEGRRFSSARFVAEMLRERALKRRR